MSAESRTPWKAWPGLKFNRRKWDRKLRTRVRRALHCIDPNDPDAGEMELCEPHRHRGKWDCW